MKKNYYRLLGIILGVSFGLWNAPLMADDIEAVLDSSDTSSAFVVQDSTTNELFRVRGDGNVGIGTTSPSATLEVEADSPETVMKVTGTASSQTLLEATFNPTSNGLKIDGAGDIWFKNSGGAYSTRLYQYLDDLKTDSSFIVDGSVGIGTVGVPATSAKLEIASTTGALLVSRMTTAQRDALTAVNGMIIYNTTTNAFNFYENGSWVTK